MSVSRTRQKRGMTIEELMESVIYTVEQMTPEEKAQVREVLMKDYLMIMKCSPVIQ